MALPIDVYRLIPAFLASAEAQSFSAAARQLGISAAAVSKNVRALEMRLNIRLFARNTHFVMLTEEGADFRRRITPLWQALNQALDERQLSEEPSGLVRVSVIPGFGRHRLMPLLPIFSQRFPKVTIDLEMEPRLVNLIGENIDVAIGQRTATDSRLVGREMCVAYSKMAASPEYLARLGTPQTIDDLLSHHRLIHRNSGSGKLMAWWDDEGSVNEQQASFIATSPDNLVDAALSHMGIVCLADWYLEEHFRSGRLIPILEPFWPQARSMHIWYPSADIPPRVRVWVDFVLPHFPPRS